MPSLKPLGAEYVAPDPALVRKLGEPWAPAPVRPGLLPPSPPPLPRSRPDVPQYITVSEKVQNPAWKPTSAIKPVPASQTVMVDKYGIPTGQVGTRVPMNSPAAVPQWITIQRQILNPAFAAPVAPIPAVRRQAPIPMMPSFALQAQRAMTPVTMFQAQGLSPANAYAAANAAAAAKAKEKSKSSYTSKDSSSGFGNSTASSNALGYSLMSSIS
jgi:hypothetical protein